MGVGGTRHRSASHEQPPGGGAQLVGGAVTGDTGTSLHARGNKGHTGCGPRRWETSLKHKVDQGDLVGLVGEGNQAPTFKSARKATKWAGVTLL